MNRKQREVKRKKACYHKLRCSWLKGNTPRQFRKHDGRLRWKVRISRKKLKELGERTLQRYVELANSIDEKEFMDL